MISIHALLAESDSIQTLIQAMAHLFLSTLSLRRATNINSSVNTADQISIHALLAESDIFGFCEGGVSFISIHALLAESDCFLLS